MESHGTLGTIWASFGMTAYYMALTWINILLGLFLSPLFVIPLTWLKQKQGGFESYDSDPLHARRARSFIERALPLSVPGEREKGGN